jgi:trimeric autotransporter adhesin
VLPADASTQFSNLQVAIQDLFPDRASYEAAPGANQPEAGCVSALSQTVTAASYDPATRIFSFTCQSGSGTTTTQCFTYDGVAVSSAASGAGLAYPTSGTPPVSQNILTVADCIGFGGNNDRALNSPGLIPAGGPIDPVQLFRDGFEPPVILTTTTTINTVLPSPATIGEPYTVTAQVTSPSGRPTGAMLFSDAAGANCTATLVADGTDPNRANATCALTSQSAGTRTVRATYAGRVGFDGSTGTTALIVGIGSQTINFTSPAEGASVTYSPAGTIPLVATGGNSGNPIVFASTTPTFCTVSTTVANTVNILGAGPCTITANQAGNANYTAAPQVTRNFTIAKANQTITFPQPDPKPFGATFQVSATGGGSGNPVIFSSTNGARCTVNGTTVTPQAVDVCTIRAQQAGNANYNTATQVERQITITRGTGSLTFNAQGPFPLAGGNFTLAFTPGPSTGQVTFVSLTPNICTQVSGATFTPVATGLCVITATHEEDAFYFASPTIKRDITIN